MSKQKPDENYDICIHGNTEDAFQKAVYHARAGDHVALVHSKNAEDEDFCRKEEIILQALYASAQTVQTIRASQKFGIKSEQPEITWPKVKAHIQDALERIAPHYSFEKLKALGVHIIQGPVQDETISAKEVIDLQDKPEASEDKFKNINALNLAKINQWNALPEHLIILGNGPQALSLAQSLYHLGCKTTLVSETNILPGFDRELYEILFKIFDHQGIRLIQNADITKIDQSEKIIVHMMHQEAKRRVSGSDLLILNEKQEKDVFCLSDPAAVQIGMNEEQAQEELGTKNYHLIKWRYQECDFANAMHKIDGLMKIITKQDGTVLGVGICGTAAQELILPWSVAINNTLKISNMKDLSSAYSSYGRMITLSVDGYISQISNPSRLFKTGSFWQSLIGGQ